MSAQKFIIADGHVDLPYRLRVMNFRLAKEFIGIPIESEKGEFDFVRSRKGGLDAPFMSIYVPASLQEEAGASKLMADTLIDMVKGIADAHPKNFQVVSTPSQIVSNHKKGIVSLPLGMENGSPIEDDINNVAYFKKRGISYITLTHSLHNQICDSSYDTVKAWKKFVDDGLPPAFRRNVTNLNQRTIIDDWAGNIATASNKRKGNFGEIGADLDLNAKNYESLQPRIDGIDSPGHNGLDGAYKKNGEYFIVEGKYSGSANLNPANPATGLPKQMTDDWISQNDWQRLRDAVGTDVADDIIATGYKRILAKTAPDGTVTYNELDAAANIIGDWTP